MNGTKHHIVEALDDFDNLPLRESAKHFLGVLGYRSERVPSLNGIEDLLSLFDEQGHLTQKQRAMFDDWTDARAVFQMTDDELSAQANLLRANGYEQSRAESFLFLAANLADGKYTRGRLAEMTRAVNRLFAMPAVVLFRHRTSVDVPMLTVAVVHRRAHRRDPDRDVLERVTLVKDIRLQNPHRAHVDVLAELSLEAIGPTVRTFDQLHAAWERALDTEPLNRRFYKELFTWFERAVAKATWPPDAPPEQQVIRCITRLLFTWFIKEKGLVAREWFEREAVEELLHEFGGSDYYRAVLQNLFFAALNAPIDQRRWSTRGHESHRVFTRWRYRSLIRDTERFETLMARTPFINGGLFDCLDDEKSRSRGGKRYDMFSDPDPEEGPAAAEARRNAWRDLSVPDRLFFDDDGLFALFNRYKFTVEENTPAETEVALDPELLGQVFENLLAAYNPETRDTARKQTGSYYTPRPVVDYMVGEALAGALTERAQPEDGDAAFWRERVHYLLDYEDAGELFEEPDAQAVVEAIADLKVLDPAVGSGAFPMAVLNKLTLALRRLDPDNELWRKVQKERAARRAGAAFDAEDRDKRDADLLEISNTFERYSGDFGRKLYLVQNSIFGVDIQAIACQIAKLRFFISLVIEQDYDPGNHDNFGIRPLPNLETRFVAADALLGFKRERGLASGSNEVRRLEWALQANREQHFHANTRPEKLGCMEEDSRLRAELADELRRLGFPEDTADLVAGWDPYSQNSVANWFDPEYMFGERGFDIVVGNPPYRQLQKERGALANKYKDAGFRSLVRTGDLYQLFIERGIDLLSGENSVLAYVTSNSWQKAKYGGKTRDLLDEHTPLRFINLGPGVFENATVDTCILIVKRGRDGGVCRTAELGKGDQFPPDESDWADLRQIENGPWCVLSRAEWSLMEKIEAAGRPLREWPGISINYGIKTGLNKAFIIGNETKEALIREDPRSAELLKPLVRGRDVHAYRVCWAGRWLIDTHNGYGDTGRVDVDRFPGIRRHLHGFMPGLERRQDQGDTPYNLRSCAYYGEFERPKVLWPEISDEAGFALCREQMFCNNKVYFLTAPALDDLLFLFTVLSSGVIRWYGRQITVTTGAGSHSWFKYCVEALPIPPRGKEWPAMAFVAGDGRAIEPSPARPTALAEQNAAVAKLYGLTSQDQALLDSLNASV